MSLHDLLAEPSEGRRGLAAARLRYDVISALHEALNESGMTRADLASVLGVRRSAVNAVFRGTGNLRANTIADYLHALGLEGQFVVRRARVGHDDSGVGSVGGSTPTLPTRATQR